jgi:predicted ATPase/DNA-binding SARP family transcriptional activator
VGAIVETAVEDCETRRSRPVAKVEIRVLGELQVLRGGRVLALPASRKTRALLGYLVVSSRAHLRERLCDLLWDGPEDPRAELRWSLAKLRPLLNQGTVERLRADRERIAFEAREASVDLVRVQALLAPGVTQASLDALREAVRLLEGEFLDGLDLPACPRFHEWCMGEREAASAVRARALKQLVARLAERPEEALGYARKWVAADPLSEPGHAAVVRLLGALGRGRDALAQLQYSRRLLEAELASALSGELDAAGRALRRDAPPPRAFPEEVAEPAEPVKVGQAPFVGRQAECAELDAFVARAASADASPVMLCVGEPGIGKTRLLTWAAERAAAAGGLALTARAFEVETARPYGVWLDALRAIPRQDIPAALEPDLAVLLPELKAKGGAGGDRLRLFDAVAQIMSAAAARHGLLALLVDDLQWADDASCALLHYVVRACRGASRLFVACTGRAGELQENAAARNLLQSLRRERQLRELRVGPLSAGETADLVKAVAPGVDGRAVFSETEGNPLFALELAQARARGLDWTEHTLGSLIADQLARLDGRARDVLAYAAALGRAFTAELLAPACGFDAAPLVGALGELERRALIRAADGERYDFAHDLVRQAAYRGLSQPRRRLVHAQIARSLTLAAAGDETLYPELARHASWAGEDELAAQAFAAAGERSLRAFANVEAAAQAQTGLRHLQRLPPRADRLPLRLSLLGVRLLARSVPGNRRPEPALAGELAEAIALAQAAGLHAEAATGYHLLATWHQEAGDLAKAQEITLLGAGAGRAADQASRARHLARTARCLLDLERDVDRARGLVKEAATAAAALGPELHELRFAEGLLQRWDGAGDEAAQSLADALTMARRAQDRWSEYRCLMYLMMVELERGRHDRLAEYAGRLIAVATDMGESDVPFARVLRSVAALPEDPDAAYRQLGEALSTLREASDKSLLAYSLNEAALRLLDCGRPVIAREFSTEALGAARAMRRESEALIASAILAAAGPDGAQPAARGWKAEAVSARARGVIARIAAPAITTPAPTAHQ